MSKKLLACSCWILALGLLISSCKQSKNTEKESETSTEPTKVEEKSQSTVKSQPTIQDLGDKKSISKPLVTHIYTADPSAHVFNGKLYVYPSHDVENEPTTNQDGGHFNMVDYHVFSLDNIGDSVIDNGEALHLKDVPWASKQMWAPDAAMKDGVYYLYFPAKDKEDIFRIGVATSDSPVGPFKAEPEPIEGAYSIDPSVYEENGEYYLYFGGIWGGQLQNWRTGVYDPNGKDPKWGDAAMVPKVSKLNPDMKSLAEEPKEVQILDKDGKPLLTSDEEKRFFEAAWLHKFNGKYYFSYSTGNSHFIAYGIGDTPYGPFTYQGNILNPVLGWTNHHSIVEFENKWYLFYHDSEFSNDRTHLRTMKMTELKHNADGSITTIEPYQ